MFAELTSPVGVTQFYGFFLSAASSGTSQFHVHRLCIERLRCLCQALTNTPRGVFEEAGVDGRHPAVADPLAVGCARATLLLVPRP